MRHIRHNLSDVEILEACIDVLTSYCAANAPDVPEHDIDMISHHIVAALTAERKTEEQITGFKPENGVRQYIECGNTETTVYKWTDEEWLQMTKRQENGKTNTRDA